MRSHWSWGTTSRLVYDTAWGTPGFTDDELMAFISSPWQTVPIIRYCKARLPHSGSFFFFFLACLQAAIFHNGPILEMIRLTVVL